MNSLQDSQWDDGNTIGFILMWLSLRLCNSLLTHAETQFGKKYEFVFLLIHLVSLWLKSVDKDSFIAVYNYEWQCLIY